ncbi:MAG: hypothetical protein AAF411_28545, partial [Myxococcota bacterium]
QSMEGGERYEEWIDLRMYCSGRALRALRSGPAVIDVAYGFARRGRGRFVAKGADERRPPHQVQAEPLSWAGPSGGASDGPLRVGLMDTTARSRRSVRLRPTLRAGSEGRPYVYLRDDQFSFDVLGPDGTETRCERPRVQIVPIVDRYARLSRRKRRFLLDAAYFCPDGTFEQAGVYVVTPTLVLPHAGPVRGNDALTGRFVGSPGVVRVRGAYAVQSLEGQGG